MKDLLVEKIRSKKITVGVIGLGYVGLPLILRFGECGFKVMGFDVDADKVHANNEGKSYIKHIPSEKISALRQSGKYEATNDLSRLSEADAILICVPTPLDTHNDPDLKYVEQTSVSLQKALRPGQMISLESTTYPGTTEEVVLPILKKSGLTVGKDFYLVYSPEREDPGNPKFSTQTIPKVVGGITKRCLEAGIALYESIIDKVIPVSTTQAAEMTKLLENIYRSVNIAMVNELKILADKMGIDLWEVIDAAATKPFGFQPFYPGPGLGGHCIPIDPFYLSWKAKEYGIPTRFIELSGEINGAMPDYVVSQAAELLNTHKKCINGSKILLIGMAYKRDVDDLRESPGLRIMERLQKLGGNVSYYDPYIPSIPPLRNYKFDMKSVKLTPKTVSDSDIVIIVTDHSCIDYKLIQKHAPVVLDTRNALKRFGTKNE